MKENRCSRRKSSILVGVLAVMCVSAAAVEAAPTINEFSASTAGTDVEYVEIFGSPNTDYSSYTVLEIEGDGAGAGVIDEIITVGTTDAAGFWLANLPANSLENGSLTLLLVEGFIGALGMDLDADNDGAFDTSPWLSMVDAVAVNDGGVGDVFYDAPVLGPNYDGISAFAPGGASRIPDSLDTDTAGDWVRNDFDLAGIPGQTGTAMLGEALNTPGGPNQVYEDQPDPPEVCGDPFTPIYVVQGNGLASPLAGTEVSIEGVVVGDFQNNSTPDSGDLDGFYVQDPLGDGDTATSDGLFVYAPGGLDVSFGDAVRVRGTVLEFGGLTQISVSQILLCSSGNLVSPAVVSLPVTSLEDLERHEGMLVVFPQELTISEYFNFDRFGEIVLTIGRQFQPTAIFPPGSLEAAELAAFNALSRITLDDGRTEQNPDPAIHPNGGVFDLSNLFRGGDIVQDVTGVLDDRFGRYGIQPVTGATLVPVNPRPDEPEDVGGSIKIAAFNVLNYFTTLDSRGANNAEEFTRQRDKIFAALARIDADVVGLIEIENNGTALDDLVDGLNQFIGQPLYVALQTGVIGTDEIAVAFIYKSSSVTPMGAFAVLDDPAFVDPAASGIPRNRPALAQTFMDNSSGGVVTAVVNHFKSKGSECGAGDDDPEQGNCNLTRTLAAQVLLDWLATDPTGSGDANVLILGDLNSYDKEQPIALITSAFVDLLRLFHGELAYTYVFNGQLGYLDYALASAGLLDEVTGATAWHINSDEPDLIDYDTTFKQDDQDALYAPDQFRSSDHDPVIVGLSLTPNAIRLLDRLLAAVRELELRRPLEGALSARVLVARELLADQKPRNDHVAIVSLKSLVRVVERWEGRLLTAEEAERLVHQTEIIIGVL